MSTVVARGKAPPNPCSRHRDWGGGGQVEACPIMPWPGWLLSPWPPLLMSPVFTHPLDAKTAAGGGKVMGGGLCVGGRAWGSSVQSTLEEVSGQVPRGLPGFLRPLICSCPALRCLTMGWEGLCPHPTGSPPAS